MIGGRRALATVAKENGAHFQTATSAQQHPYTDSHLLTMELAARTNVPCVGMIYTGLWRDRLDLENFLTDIPPRFKVYGSILLRRAPNKFDDNGTLAVVLTTRSRTQRFAVSRALTNLCAEYVAGFHSCRGAGHPGSSALGLHSSHQVRCGGTASRPRPRSRRTLLHHALDGTVD